MNTSKALLIVLLSVSLLISCGQKTDRSKEDLSNRKINAVATIGMITDIVSQVGGERVKVTGLMGPGVDPHLYKATEGDLHRMMNADIIFYNGLHLEGKMAELLEQMQKRVKTSAVTNGIHENLLLSPEEFKGAHDPHVWFDVIMWMKAVENVRDAFIDLDSEHIKVYWDNAQAYIKQLTNLQKYVKNKVAQLPLEKRILITAHDAFNYFGRAYDFEVRGLQGISTATEAGTADVQSLAQFIVENKVRAIFVESSVPHRNIEALQEAVASKKFQVKIGGNLFSDAMGDSGTPEGTYIGMVKHNIDTIVNALLK